MRTFFIIFAMLLLLNIAEASLLEEATKIRYAINNGILITHGTLAYNTFVPFFDFPFKGNGSKVAIIDSGINDANPWFKDAYFLYKGGIYYNDTLQQCIDTSDYQDYDGHGTHVAGIVRSLAPNASFIILKPKTLSERNILCAMKKAKELNADIVSMSLGGFSIFTDGYDDLLYEFIENESKTMVFSVAAGNEGYARQHYNLSDNESLIVSNYAGSIALLTRYYDVYANFSIELRNASNNALLVRAYIQGSSSNTYILHPDISYQDLEVELKCSKTQCYYYFYFDFPYDLNVSYALNKSTELDIYDIYYYAYRFIYNSLYPHTPYSIIASPAIAPSAVAVGSFISHVYEGSAYGARQVGEVSAFSSQGPVRHNYSILKPNILAPGEQINSSSAFSNYEIKSGTSMATPFITGVLAIIKSMFPNASASQLKSYLYALANPNAYMLSAYSKWEKGKGLVNLSLLSPYLVMHEYWCPPISTNPYFYCIANLTNYGLYPYKGIGMNENGNVSISVEHDCDYAGKCNYAFPLPGWYKPFLSIASQTLAYSNISSKLDTYILSPYDIKAVISLNNRGFSNNVSVRVGNNNFSYLNITLHYNESKHLTYSLNLPNHPFIELNYSYDINENKSFIFSSPYAYNISFNVSYDNLTILDNFSINISEIFPYETPSAKTLNGYVIHDNKLSVPFYLLANSLEGVINLSYFFTLYNVSYAVAYYNLTIPYANLSLHTSNIVVSSFKPIKLCYFLNHTPVNQTLVVRLRSQDTYNTTFYTFYENNSCFDVYVPYLPYENKTLELEVEVTAGSFILAYNKSKILYDGLGPNIMLDLPDYFATSNRTIYVRMFANDSNLISNISYINESINSSNIQKILTLNLSLGLNRIVIYAVDEYGNNASYTLHVFRYNVSSSYSRALIYASNGSYVVNKEGYDETNNLYFINFTPLAPTEFLFNISYPENMVLKEIYKINDTFNISIPFYINASSYCLIYINASSDPELRVVFDTVALPSKSYSHTSLSSSGGGFSSSIFYVEEPDENTTINESVALLTDSNLSLPDLHEENNTPQHFSNSNTSHAIDYVDKGDQENVKNASNGSYLIWMIGFGVLCITLCITLYYKLFGLYSNQKPFILEAYDTLGYISEDVYNKVKQNYKCKTFISPEKGIKEITYVLKGNKGWHHKILIKLANGKILVAKPHNPTA